MYKIGVYKRRYLLCLVILSLIYGAIFFALNVLKYRSFFSYEWEDDAGENQVVYNIADSFRPSQTIFVSNFFFNRFTPIYFLVALFYRIYPHIYTWYFLVSFAYGFSSLIVYLLARDILRQQSLGFILAISYLLYSPLHYINLGTLDGNIFSLPLLFLTLYFLFKRNFFQYCFFMVLSCMCKEDVPLVILLLGVYELIKKYPRKWWLTTVIFAGLYFMAAVYISNNLLRVTGFCSNIDNRNFEYFDAGTVKGILSFMLFHTKEAATFIFSWSHVRVFILVLFPLIFLPAFSLEAYIPMVMFSEILLSRGFSNTDSYHLAPIIPFLFISLIFTLRRVSDRIFWKKNIFYVALVILLLCFLSNFGRNIIGCIPAEGCGEVHDTRFLDVRNIFDRRFFTVDEEDRLAWKLVDLIPKDAPVTASGDFLPALSSRKILYEFGLNNPKAVRNMFCLSDYPSYDVDYILIHKEYMPHGLGGHYAFLKRQDLHNEIKELIDKHVFSVLVIEA